MFFEFKNGKELIRKPIGDNTFITIIAGDCCPWESAIETIRAGRAADIIDAVKPFLDSADYKIIQFEAPLTNRDTPIDKSGPNLKCPPECLNLLREAGFDMALLANNHIGDHGCEVAMETISHLNNAGIKTVGAGKNLAAANSPAKMICNGVRVAILNFAENEFGTAKKNSAGCASLNLIDNIKSIKLAAKTSDLVFVVVHGGHECNPAPSPRMISTYRAFAEAGASMVMNIHTHCPEGIELWNGIPIVYSPGNFFFPWTDLTADHLSAMWWFGYLPKFYCDCAGVYALEIMPYRFDNERLYKLTYEDEKYFFEYMSDLNRIISDPEEVEHYFHAWVAHRGAYYLSWFRDRLAAWPIALDRRKSVHDLLVVRNCFTCESHNDLITSYLRLIEEGKIAKALDYWPAIKEFQCPAWAEKYWQETLQNQRGN